MAKSQSKELSNAKAVLKALGDSQEVRTDGYQNMLTKYGTKQDSSTAFSFVPEEFTDDYTLSINYQFNGLFAKIIDLPAGEAVSKGFKLNINNEDVEKEVMKKCAQLNLEENFETAIKWSRLYGGAIAVMLIYDGRGLDEPLNYKTIRGIDEIKVYESAVVNPLYNSSYYSGEPEHYQVNALEGSFIVHASRCLIFRNGILPQQVCDSKRRIFGFAEYDRIKTTLRETVTSHGYAPRMLERAIQSVIKIKDLASLLGTSKGEDFVVKRLQLIDMARSMFNSMAIDAEGEDFDFKAAPYTGVKEVLDSTCNMLSAVTNIPQTLLFGSSPQGMDSTGESDLENWYNYVRQIQKKTVKSPLEKILGIIIQVLVRTGNIDDYPDWELEFEPLWSMSEAEQAQVDLTRAQVKLAKAQTAQMYVDMQALDSSEIRAALAKTEEYDVETILDDVPNDELFASMIDESSDDTPPVPPAMTQEGVEAKGTGNNVFEQGDFSEFAKDSEIDAPTAAAVLVVNREGKILCGVRSDNNLVCGPGGHIEEGEQPIVAAIRESKEEFGITPTSLIPLATLGENNALHHKTDIFLCTSFSGTPKCDDKEMKLASFITLEELLENRDKMFKPFLDSLEVLAEVKKKTASLNSDEGNANSGNHGHKGVPGQIGGSAPTNGSRLSNREKPQVLGAKDFDDYIKENGLIPIYRGFSASSEEQQGERASAIQNASVPESSDKSSALGRGVYFSNSKEEATSYMQRRQGETGERFGQVSTAALDVGAKVCDYDEIRIEYQEKLSQSLQQVFGIMKEKGRDSEEYKKAESEYRKLEDMKVDGYVRSEGYDAISHPATGYVVVVNQKALVVRSDSDSKKTIDTVSTSDIMKMKEQTQLDGGPGSGHFGHKGDPGNRGGSLPSNDSVSRIAKNKSWQKYKNDAKEKCKSVFPKNPDCSEGTNYKGEKVGLAVQTKEAQELYNEISKGNLKTVEELRESPVLQKLDSISAECKKALSGETISDSSPEREKLRDDIRTEFLNNGSARVDENGNYVYDGEVKKEHKACIVIGLPAVGKSTLVDPMSQEKGMFILDNDMIKEMIPEFSATGGATAGAVHEESSMIQKSAFNEFLKGDRKGDNLAIPIIGGNPKKVMSTYIEPLESAGYDVEVKYVDGDPETSCNRVVSRAIETGRIIESNVVLGYGTKPAESYEWFKNQSGKNGNPYVREEDKR